MSERRPARSAVAVAVVLVVAVVFGGALAITRPWHTTPTCSATVEHPEWSVARRWDEALLDAIRRALPAPTVHARNLFHTSAAMWDAWAAYEPSARGYFVTEKRSASDVPAARAQAISFAAYRVLESRYEKAMNGTDSLIEFDGLMKSLCYDIDDTSTEGDSPAALGNRIAAAAIAFGLTDGSNQANGYVDAEYKPVNAALIVDKPGAMMADPNRWQPLQLEKMISQNGIAVTNGTQQCITPQWGHVTSFALPDGGPDGVPIDPGPPPQLGDPATDAAYKDEAVQVIRRSSLLDPTPGTMIDISPAALGDNTLGTNDGKGHAVDPATGSPYAPNMVNEGDFARVLAEFWADGPKSETPPGHWNVIANTVGDAEGQALRIGGQGAPVDRLEWDVKLYLALNGAVHDAAIEAWGLKGHYDSPRPISLIRYMGGLGQSSDPNGSSYDPDGLPLEAGLIEVVTKESSAPGRRHAALADHVGEIAIKAWAGNPKDPETQTSGVTWILAVDWVPYQAPTFVTPAFQGYVSGHSTFSRSAAEVLTGFTGDPYFPGGMSEWTIKQGSLKFEAGPTAGVTLQWATYFDAADQAGVSRIYGGIHPEVDDFTGRRLGSRIGQAAWAHAQTYYGTATASLTED